MGVSLRAGKMMSKKNTERLDRLGNVKNAVEKK